MRVPFPVSQEPQNPNVPDVKGHLEDGKSSGVNSMEPMFKSKAPPPLPIPGPPTIKNNFLWPELLSAQNRVINILNLEKELEHSPLSSIMMIQAASYMPNTTTQGVDSTSALRFQVLISSIII